MEEWEAAFGAYRAAEARINNAGAYLTLERWMQRVGALRPNLPPAFITDITSVLAASRRMARRLAQAWYQYARALDTGYQLGSLEDGVLDGTLDRLRQNFLDRLQEVAQLGFEDPDDLDESVLRFAAELREAGYDSGGDPQNRRNVVPRRILDRHIQDFLDSWGDDLGLEYEEFEWRTDSDLDDLRDWVTRHLRQEARRETEERRGRIREQERQREETVSDEELEAEHEKAGQRVAGEVHAATADAARKLHEWAHFKDQRVMWVARGTSASPCGFCAMLASRSASPNTPNYTSVQSAMLTRNSAKNPDDYLWVNGFRKVHPNCNCYPIIKWKDGSGGTVTETAREFLEIWNDTRDFNAFRRAIYKRNKQLQAQAESQEE